MSDTHFEIEFEDWPECLYLGCIHNKDGKCHSGLNSFRIQTRIITDDFQCTAAIVPCDTCEFCGNPLEKVEGSLSCSNGCF